MSSVIRKSARNEPCQLRLDGCLSGGQNETTVLAHINGGGMALKRNDYASLYCCASCHDFYDMRKQAEPPYDKEWLELQALRAMVRTQEILIKKGLM